MRIGVDSDGVLYDFAKSFAHYLEEFHGIRGLPEPTIWNFHEEWEMDISDWLDYFKKGVDAGVIFVHGDAHEGAHKYMTKLQEDGHTLHICTNRRVGNYSIENTSMWLKQNKIPYDTLTFSADKTIIDVDIFIEDNVENYINLKNAGGNPVMMSRPWNAHLEDCNRVNDWEEFYNYVSASSL